METTSQSGIFAWWHRTPLYLRIVGAMVVGVLVGVIFGPGAHPAPTAGKQELGVFWTLAPMLSKLVLRVLGALAPMLILLAIAQALMTAKFEKGTTGRLLRLLVLNTVVAIVIGIVVADVLRPGHWSQLSLPDAKSTEEAGGSKPGMLEQFLENVPQSLLGPLGDDGKVMGVIFIAVAFGIALRKVADRPLSTVADFVDIALKTLVTVLHWVVEIVPFAVFGLVASIIGLKGFAAFHALGWFILAVLTGLALQATYYLLRVYFGTWINPFALLRGTRDALVMAFSTGSSTITMPVTYECLKTRVGLREKSASLGALVGSNFNNDGTALYEAMAALFVSQMLAAQGLGVELTLGQQITVVLTSVIASVGAAGIPEAGLVTMTLVFNAVGLPTGYIVLLLPVDWFLDRCRTAINVMGDMNVSCMFDGKTREVRDAAPTPAPVLAEAAAV